MWGVIFGAGYANLGRWCSNGNIYVWNNEGDKAELRNMKVNCCDPAVTRQTYIFKER